MKRGRTEVEVTAALKRGTGDICLTGSAIDACLPALSRRQLRICWKTRPGPSKTTPFPSSRHFVGDGTPRRQHQRR